MIDSLTMAIFGESRKDYTWGDVEDACMRLRNKNKSLREENEKLRTLLDKCYVAVQSGELADEIRITLGVT